MSVYLGSYGNVYLKRKSAQGEKASVVNPSDINTSRKRFSFDFDSGFLVSGDQIEITTTAENRRIEFVSFVGWLDQTVQTSGKWYINVDELGGIRLYSTFVAALEGNISDAIPLVSLANELPITVKIANTVPRMLGQCSAFELNTNREAVDTTALSEEFRSQYSTLMSGSGQFTAFWDYVDTNQPAIQEAPHYLLQLALRTEIGSEFSAQFFLKSSGYTTSTDVDLVDDQLWYEINGIITQAGVSFTPDGPVQVVADFLTTGPIRLKAKLASESRLLQESASGINLEQDNTSFLLLDRDQ
jgi:hypothetical protein